MTRFHSRIINGVQTRIPFTPQEEIARDAEEAQSALEAEATQAVLYKTDRDVEMIRWEKHLFEIFWIIGKEIVAINTQIGRTPHAGFTALKNKFQEIETNNPPPP